jgi:hypothetical protein
MSSKTQREAVADVARRTSENRARNYEDINRIGRTIVRRRLQHAHDVIERAADHGSMKPEDERRFLTAVRQAASDQRDLEKVAELEREARARASVSAAVTSEPRTYSREGEHSFFVDVARLALGPADEGYRAAKARIDRHGIEVGHEMRANSREGRVARAQLRELTRTEDRDAHRRAFTDEETRAASTASMAGFVTPVYVLDQWAAYRDVQRTFADQLDRQGLPEYGLAVHVPSFASAASEAQQSPENSAGSETDPSGADHTTTVKTIEGHVTIAQQLHDRGMTGGGSFDLVVGRQLRQHYDQQVDAYALAQALSGAGAVAGQSTFGFAGFYQDLASCREKLTDAAGVRLRPTHVFTTSDLHSYATRQVDATTNRPVVVPQFAPGVPLWDDGDDSKWAGFTGTVLPGAALWFTDDSIPASGSNTQLVVSRPDTILAFEGAPVLRAFEETDAAQLSVVVQLYGYACVLPRYPKATAVATGNAYATTNA